MVLNRGIAIGKLIRTTHRLQGGVQLQSVRNSGGEWLYRAPAQPRRQNVIIAECLGAVMWWWILYHAFSEPGHLIGEFDIPDPRKWTDEELGIPPDDEDI